MILKKPNNRKYFSFEELGVSLIDCDHRTPPPSEHGFPYVAIPQIKDGHIDFKDVRLISHENYLDWTKKAKPQPYDIVLSRRCNPGETGYVRPGLDFALGQNLVLLRSNNTKIHPQFLRWLVRGPEWWDQIAKFLNVGAIFDSLKCADIPNFQFSIPPLPTQKAIAHILGTLDDKIELNRRMNETLESIARAIFKSWFIDFDPVRAKAEGRQPEGMDAATAALFPSEFETVEGQEIPKGWQLGILNDVIRVNETTIGPGFGYSKINYIDISSVNVGKLENFTEYNLKERPSRAQKIIKHGDTIWSCVRPNRRSYLYISNPLPNTIVSTGFAVLTPSKIPSSYLFFWTTTDFFVEYLTNNADGSAYPAVRADHFSRAEILLPLEEILIFFHKIVEPILEKISFNENESKILSSLRDTLLPKLLSGELPIDNPEQFTGVS